MKYPKHYWKAIMVWLLIIAFCIGFWVVVVRAWGEEERLVYKAKLYHVVMNERPNMEDLRWYFNEVMCQLAIDPEKFKGRERSFTLKEVEYGND